MIQIDQRRWPIVVFTFRGVVTPAELEEYLQTSERILAKGERYAGVVLADEVKPLDVPLMRRQAAWIKEHEAALRRQSLGVAFVIGSPMIRGVLRAILWLQPMPQPHTLVSTEEEAIAWVRNALLRRPPPGVADVAGERDLSRP
jgi:hypothetical protein